jgi:hypothetical protein
MKSYAIFVQRVCALAGLHLKMKADPDIGKLWMEKEPR